MFIGLGLQLQLAKTINSVIKDYDAGLCFNQYKK